MPIFLLLYKENFARILTRISISFINSQEIK